MTQSTRMLKINIDYIFDFYELCSPMIATSHVYMHAIWQSCVSVVYSNMMTVTCFYNAIVVYTLYYSMYIIMKVSII